MLCDDVCIIIYYRQFKTTFNKKTFVTRFVKIVSLLKGNFCNVSISVSQQMRFFALAVACALAAFAQAAAPSYADAATQTDSQVESIFSAACREAKQCAAAVSRYASHVASSLNVAGHKTIDAIRPSLAKTSEYCQNMTKKYCDKTGPRNLNF